MRLAGLLALLPLAAFGAGLPAQGGSNAAGLELARRIEAAQDRTAFRGTRLYGFLYEGKQRLQREFIAVKPGSGPSPRIKLQLLDVLQHTREFPGLGVARTLFERRQASTYKTRDFRIQDLALARRNYIFHALGKAKVAGRECSICYVLPRQGDRRAWQLWVDQASGLVLRADEYAPDFKLLSVMVFEAQGLEIGQGTRFTGVSGWWSAPGRSTGFSTVSQAETAFGAGALLPTYLPAGYMLATIALREPGQGATYLTVSYTDGVDTLFVVNRLLPPSPGENSPGSGDTPIVNRFTSGSLVQLWTETRGYMVMVMGRLAENQVPATFESVFLAR